MDWLKILGPTLLMVLGGGITWFIKSRMEELQAIKEKLRKEQRDIYDQILDPYVRLFTDIKGKGVEDALRKINSYDYKKTALSFTVTLISTL